MRSIGAASLIALLMVNSPSDEPSPSNVNDKVTGIAQTLIANYRETDRDTYLDNLLRLQIVAGRYAEARKTIATLRDLRTGNPAGLSPASNVQFEVYAEAKLRETRDGLPFDKAFADAFRDIVGALDDATAANQVRWVFGTSVNRLENDLRTTLAQHQDLTSLSQTDSIDLVRRFLAAGAFRSFAASIDGLLDEDDQRRYIIERDTQVTTPDGAHICTLIFRPRRAKERLPALLNFTIYSAPYLPMFEARRTASHGYVGVEGFTRGKACSPDTPVPAEHDGSDAAALIDWISKQPWSDGRVGTYGGSYEGFTQWAAAKHMPKALKAMMPSVSFAPAFDFPMEGNVFMTYAYPWPFYTTNTKQLDNATYYDKERWDRLNQKWYVSGRPYRDLDRIDGTPNPLFDRWLDHPSYDAYWKSMVPYGEEFARINIPVLTTTGYYDSGQIGALHYVQEHYKYSPHADHYLVIGPYDHVAGQRGTVSPTGRRQSVLRNYELDSVAHMDIGELRYQWFDYVLRGAPKPALLADKINYEVMGANVWKHAPSLAAMHDSMWKLHLSAVQHDHRYGLSERKPPQSSVVQTVDLADRSDAGRLSRGEIIDQSGDEWNIVSKAPLIGNAIEFISAPLATPVEISGLFSGKLAVVCNKKDFDFSVTLFEVTAANEYFQLSYYWSRASYVRDRSHRTLLTPGKRAELAFENGRLTSRQLKAGSRLLVVLGVIKQPGEQINYGTGKSVSDESIADAGAPLRIRWLTDSYINVPIRK